LPKRPMKFSRRIVESLVPRFVNVHPVDSKMKQIPFTALIAAKKSHEI
jgi:hypothetical protein